MVGKTALNKEMKHLNGAYFRTIKVDSPYFNTNYDILNKLKEYLNPHEDIAYVVYYYFYNDSIKWIQRAIPIIDNISPMECISSKGLINRLREALLRTPL